MSYLITSLGGKDPREIMVDGELFNSDADTIKSVIGDLSPGAIIYTAGFGTIKQKGLDGSWVEVV